MTKRMLLAKPIMTASNGAAVPTVYADVDSNVTATPSDDLTVSGGTPWGSPWGSPWTKPNVTSSEWCSVYGLGRRVSLKMKGRLKGSTVKLNGFQVVYEPGGVL